MGVVCATILLSFLIGLASSDTSYGGSFDDLTTEYPLPPECRPNITCRVEYILQKRQPDSGWKEHTHRANIALAVNNWFVETTDEVLKRRIELQLDVEITKALLRNNSEKIHENDLALYTHALIAKSKNPRNFHGIDLVEDLLHRVDTEPGQVHPFLVLALCNSYAVDIDHLNKLKPLIRDRKEETRRETELKALTLKAFACAASLNTGLNKFKAMMVSAADNLINKQKEDGSFGNAYTTSLVVQALIAYNGKEKWNKHAALDYLEEEACKKVNMIKAYYIEMALNADRVKFIKDLYTGPPLVPGTQTVDRHYVMYTVKTGESPDIYHTITIKVGTKISFYEVMQICSKISKNFRFEFYTDQQGDPVVYSVAGIPNDAEENMFWRLCEQNSRNGDRHNASMKSYLDSPNRLKPKGDDHYIFWYRNRDCQGL